MKDDNKIIVWLILIVIILAAIFAFKVFSSNGEKKDNTYYNNYNGYSNINSTNTIYSNKTTNINAINNSNKYSGNNGIYSSSKYDYLSTFTLIIMITFIILPVIGLWKIFSDQGIPGWQSIIPILNIYRMLQIAGLSGYLVFTMFIPLIGQILLLIYNIIFAYKLAKLYNKGLGYTLGLLFLPPIFYPLIAFKK